MANPHALPARPHFPITSSPPRDPRLRATVPETSNKRNASSPMGKSTSFSEKRARLDDHNEPLASGSTSFTSTRHMRLEDAPHTPRSTAALRTPSFDDADGEQSRSAMVQEICVSTSRLATVQLALKQAEADVARVNRECEAQKKAMSQFPTIRNLKEKEKAKAEEKLRDADRALRGAESEMQNIVDHYVRRTQQLAEDGFIRNADKLAKAIEMRFQQKLEDTISKLDAKYESKFQSLEAEVKNSVSALKAEGTARSITTDARQTAMLEQVKALETKLDQQARTDTPLAEARDRDSRVDETLKALNTGLAEKANNGQARQLEARIAELEKNLNEIGQERKNGKTLVALVNRLKQLQEENASSETSIRDIQATVDKQHATAPQQVERSSPHSRAEQNGARDLAGFQSVPAPALLDAEERPANIEFASLYNQVQTFCATVNNHTQRLDNLRTGHIVDAMVEQISQFYPDLRNTQALIARLKAEQDDVKTRVNAIHTVLRELENRDTDLASKIDRVAEQQAKRGTPATAADLEQLRKRVRNLQQERNVHEDGMMKDIIGLQKEAEKHGKAIHANETAVAKLVDRVNDAKSRAIEAAETADWAVEQVLSK